MKLFLQCARISYYQIRILRKNYKIITIPFCLFVYLWNSLVPFREFLTDIGIPATPFLFPFLFNAKFLCTLIFAGILLFYVDAPFYNEKQLFVIMRVERNRWVLGNMLFLILLSIGYMLFLFLSSILFLFPYIDFHMNWGKIWTTLAVTEAGYTLGLPFTVNTSVIYQFTPMRATFYSMLLGSLICIFYGFFAWVLNLYLGKVISLFLTFTSILLITRIQYFPAWIFRITPSAWSDLSALTEYSSAQISVTRAILLLCFGIIILGVLAYRGTMRADLVHS